MVFPLYDDNPLKRARVPYVTWGLIVLNVVIFLFETGASEDAVKALLASYAATPAAITHQTPAPGWLPPELTLVSYMFLHGGGNTSSATWSTSGYSATTSRMRSVLSASSCYGHRGRFVLRLAKPQFDDAARRRLWGHFRYSGSLFAAAALRQSVGVRAARCRARASLLGHRRLGAAAAVSDRQPDQ